MLGRVTRLSEHHGASLVTRRQLGVGGLVYVRQSAGWRRAALIDYPGGRGCQMTGGSACQMTSGRSTFRQSLWALAKERPALRSQIIHRVYDRPKTPGAGATGSDQVREDR